ncbi:MAG: VWA domain-containing protein [Planctomycetes bacterium]|nr:VWA domain-containing protein [Planctomycetota bacterium]MCP4770009.1 VWA domain-containing protein [Planctomycetota bacterium]MCP4859849.1 VWA domain-containing protein [Planctomycetota bacterium]
MAKRKAPPELHLDFAEEFFGAFWKRWRGGERPRFEEFAANFDEMANPLGAVAQAFAGRLVSVRQAEASGGVVKNVVLLPRMIALSNEVEVNRRFMFARAALAGAMIAIGREVPQEDLAYLEFTACIAIELGKIHSGFRKRIMSAAWLELDSRPTPSEMSGPEEAMECHRQDALRAVIDGRWQGFPEGSQKSLKGRRKRGMASPPLLLFGGPLPPSELAAALEAAEVMEEKNGVASDATEVDAPAKDHVKRLLLEEDEYRAAMPESAFEKVMFAEKYEGGLRKTDGEDDMDEQQDSLDAVDLRELIRGGPEVHSVYKADIGDAEGIPDVANAAPGERSLRYDEWDHSQRAYRKDWVTLYPSELPGCAIDYANELRTRLGGTITRSLRHLERRRTERRSLNRQLDGNHIDIAAVVDDHALLKSGHSPSGRIYTHQPRLDRDQATTVLLDLSLSADSWIGDRRVLDVEREAAYVLGEIADRLGDSLQILAYASNTRNLCRVWEIKGWEEPWRLGRRRLGLLKPQGYTRIGPAIRHATAELMNHSARRKHMILVTDAKPTDFDRYEGNHGVHDVRQAVRESTNSGIGVHALGIDPKCAGILPVMFGVRGWKLLRSLADLPEALVSAYGELG